MIYLLMFARIFLVTTFGASSIAKLRNLPRFRRSVQGLQVVPEGLVAPTMILTLLCEILAVLLLLTPFSILQSLSFCLLIGMVLIFSFFLLRALRQNYNIACGCFGEKQKNLTKFDLWRNMGILCVAMLGLLLQQIAPPAMPNLWALGGVGLLSVLGAVAWINLEFFYQLVLFWRS